MKRKIIIDGGYWAWNKAYSRNPEPWEQLDIFVDGGAVICVDSRSSLRKEYLPWYKKDRGSHLSNEALELKERSITLTEKLLYRYPRSICYQEGLEADDLIAFSANDDDTIIANDKDMLTIHTAAELKTIRLQSWGIERIKTKGGLPVKRGNSFLAYQLMMGDETDAIPRLLPKYRMGDARWVMAQDNPLEAAIEILPSRSAVEESLYALMLPTPLLWGDIDPIQLALERHPV